MKRAKTAKPAHRGTKARLAKAAFIRWVRKHPERGWTNGHGVYWVSDRLPSQLTGAASTYICSWAPIRDVSAGSFQDRHETGPDDRVIAPLHRFQFWRYLHRHCVKLTPASVREVAR